MKVTIPYRSTAPLNPAPSPFHFGFFQNTSTVRGLTGGTLMAYRAYELTRSGDAYQNNATMPEENESCLMRVTGIPDYTPVPKGWDSV